MNTKIRLASRWLAAGSSLLVAAMAMADNGCDTTLLKSFQQAQRVVDSLRPDKSGQARVFANDGSEYTAGQSQWLKGQLRLVATACLHGDAAAAASHLSEVESTLSEHHSTWNMTTARVANPSCDGPSSAWASELGAGAELRLTIADMRGWIAGKLGSA